MRLYDLGYAMRRFPIEMSHVPDEQLQLMHGYLLLRAEAMAAHQRGPAAVDQANARGAEDALSAAIAEAEGRA